MSGSEWVRRGFELKAVDGEGVFEGYASVFDVVDQGQDVILRGAFRRSLMERGAEGIKLLWQHNPSEPIGRIDEITEDATGLHVRGRLLLDVARAREAHALMRDGALDGLSIGFHAVTSEIDEMTGIRRLIDVDLWEISLVTFPMQQAARITAFKHGPISTLRAFETFLREAGGFSRKDARGIAARGFHAPDAQREAGGGADQADDWGGVLTALHKASAIISC